MRVNRKYSFHLFGPTSLLFAFGSVVGIEIH